MSLSHKILLSARSINWALAVKVALGAPMGIKP